MAGAFAKQIGAALLMLNHVSARYLGNDNVDLEAKVIMDAIGNLTTSEYRKPVLCGRDLTSFKRIQVLCRYQLYIHNSESGSSVKYFRLR